VEAVRDNSGHVPVDAVESTVRGGKPHAKLAPSPSLLFAILVRRGQIQVIVDGIPRGLLSRSYGMPATLDHHASSGCELQQYHLPHTLESTTSRSSFVLGT
jgi:hypothetical protein